MLQLHPMIPMVTPKGKGYAMLLIDYSQEHDLVWVVADDTTGEIWAWKNSEVRMQTNITMDRILLRTNGNPSPDFGFGSGPDVKLSGGMSNTAHKASIHPITPGASPEPRNHVNSK